jgi:hypothetical protein
MSNNISEEIHSKPNSIYFSYESSGGDFLLQTIKISYNSSDKKLERVGTPGNITTTKNLTFEDEKRFMDKLKSVNFFNLKDKYLAERPPVGVYTYHLFVFIVYPSNTGLALNAIHSVTWQTGSDAPNDLFSLSKFIETL